MLKTLLLILCLGLAVPAQWVTVSGMVQGCPTGTVITAGMSANGGTGLWISVLNQDGTFLFNVPDENSVTVAVSNCDVSPRSYTIELNGGNVDGLIFRTRSLKRVRREAFGLRF